MSTVLHYPEDSETEIRIRSHRVVRQKHPVFQKDSNFHSKDISSSDLLVGSANSRSSHFKSSSSIQMSQGTDLFEGAIRAPRKCKIRHGKGQFLFTGRVRLGIAFLQCAPRLQDFQEIWKQGSNNGQNPCVVEGL